MAIRAQLQREDVGLQNIGLQKSKAKGFAVCQDLVALFVCVFF
jgi:hypothetical protein